MWFIRGHKDVVGIVLTEGRQVHKIAGVRTLIQAANATLIFAKLKTLLRNAAAWTREAVWNSIDAAIRTFPQTCTSYFRHAGYAPL